MRSIRLKSFDGKTFRVSRAAVRQSLVLEEMFVNLDLEKRPDELANPIPLSNELITAETLEVVIKWCKYYAAHPGINLKKFLCI